MELLRMIPTYKKPCSFYPEFDRRWRFDCRGGHVSPNSIFDRSLRWRDKYFNRRIIFDKKHFPIRNRRAKTSWKTTVFWTDVIVPVLTFCIFEWGIGCKRGPFTSLGSRTNVISVNSQTIENARSRKRILVHVYDSRPYLCSDRFFRTAFCSLRSKGLYLQVGLFTDEASFLSTTNQKNRNHRFDTRRSNLPPALRRHKTWTQKRERNRERNKLSIREEAKRDVIFSLTSTTKRRNKKSKNSQLQQQQQQDLKPTTSIWKQRESKTTAEVLASTVAAAKTATKAVACFPNRIPLATRLLLRSLRIRPRVQQDLRPSPSAPMPRKSQHRMCRKFPFAPREPPTMAELTILRTLCWYIASRTCGRYRIQISVWPSSVWFTWESTSRWCVSITSMTTTSRPTGESRTESPSTTLFIIWWNSGRPFVLR